MLRTLIKLIRFLFTALLILLAVTLAVSNRNIIALKFYPLPFAFELPVYLFGIILFSVGLLLGWIISSAGSLKVKRSYKTSSKRISALENELSALRAEQLICPATFPQR